MRTLLDMSPVQVIHYRPPPRPPPRPSKHVLATPPHTCPPGADDHHHHDDAAHCPLHGQHPAPATAVFELSTCQQRRMEYKQASHVPPWDIDGSVFAQRKKDSCAFFDTGCAGSLTPTPARVRVRVRVVGFGLP